MKHNDKIKNIDSILTKYNLYLIIYKTKNTK